MPSRQQPSLTRVPYISATRTQPAGANLPKQRKPTMTTAQALPRSRQLYGTGDPNNMTPSQLAARSITRPVSVPGAALPTPAATPTLQRPLTAEPAMPPDISPPYAAALQGYQQAVADPEPSVGTRMNERLAARRALQAWPLNLGPRPAVPTPATAAAPAAAPMEPAPPAPPPTPSTSPELEAIQRITQGQRENLAASQARAWDPANSSLQQFIQRQQDRQAAIAGNYDLPDSPAARRAAIGAEMRAKSRARGLIAGTQLDERGNVVQGGNVNTAPPAPFTVMGVRQITRATPVDAMTGAEVPTGEFYDAGRTASGHRILRPVNRAAENAKQIKLLAAANEYGKRVPQERKDRQRAGKNAEGVYTNPEWKAAHDAWQNELKSRRGKANLGEELKAGQRAGRLAYREQYKLPMSPETINSLRMGMNMNPQQALALRGQNMEFASQQQRQEAAERMQQNAQNFQSTEARSEWERNQPLTEAQIEAAQAETADRRANTELLRQGAAQGQTQYALLQNELERATRSGDQQWASRAFQQLEQYKVLHPEEVPGNPNYVPPVIPGTAAPGPNPAAAGPQTVGRTTPTAQRLLSIPGEDAQRISATYGLDLAANGAIDVASLSSDNVTEKLSQFTAAGDIPDGDMDSLLPFIAKAEPRSRKLESPYNYSHRRLIWQSAAEKNPDGSSVPVADRRARLKGVLEYLRAYNSLPAARRKRYPPEVEKLLPTVNGYRLVHNIPSLKFGTPSFRWEKVK